MWPMTSEGLAFLRVKALRQRVWFLLSKVERDIVGLTLRYVKEIKSAKLSLVISRIVCKILKALKSPFLREVERMGRDFVERISRIAVEWDYIQASAWTHDSGFIRYLGVNAFNASSGLCRS